MNFDSATRARLLAVFLAEAEESLALMSSLLTALLAGGKGDVKEFGRVAHGLKGAAASLGFSRLGSALHALEELALRIPKSEPGLARTRQRRIQRALELMGEGIARMSVSHQDGFPEDLLDPLFAVMSEEDGAILPPEEKGSALDDRGAVSAPASAEAPTLDRLSVPAADVDAALRLGASLARIAAQIHESLARDGAPLAASAQTLAASAQELEGIISSLRLVPAEAALSGLEEEVADLSARLSKNVQVGVSGREVRADRRTLQTARGMIRHLVRNAIDHGVEAPRLRALARKDEIGTLRVSVDAGESTLRVAVADDGSGFDLATIRAEMSRRRGNADRIASLSDEEALQLWAFDGGSTRENATEISGRGLGLSAVAQLARSAGGGIEIRSARGTGSTVTFTLPLQVYALEVLTVTAGGRTYGIPLHAVERTANLASAGGVHQGPSGSTIDVGEKILPLDPLQAALGMEERTAPERFAVVVRVDSDMVALAVEDVGAVLGVVPATVAGVAEGDALVTGVARLGDGSVVSVLNPRLLLSRARTARAVVPERHAVPAPDVPRRRPLDVILAEDSLATREVMGVLLEKQGFRVTLAADGEEALERVGEHLPDVLISDVNMPRRDGLSLTRELRLRQATARLPIILLTSQDDDTTRAAGAEAGADAYLIKSRFNGTVLEETLARLGVRKRG